MSCYPALLAGVHMLRLCLPRPLLAMQVLMYPSLLEDAQVFSQAGPALVRIASQFDLSLSPTERYPVSE